MPKFSQLLLLIFYLTGACSTQKDTAGNLPNEASLSVEAESKTDQQGCKDAVNYRWSAIQKKCVRLADAGIRLESQIGTRSLIAYVLFATSAKDTSAEVFFTDDRASRILPKIQGEAAGSWILDTLTLRRWKNVYTLVGAKGRVLYEGQAIK